jgi:hypothetical protein
VSRDISFEKEVAFKRSRRSNMQIDSERQEEMVSSPPHPSVAQKKTVELVDPIHHVDVPRDIAIGWQRSAWAHQTLQEAERYALLVVLSKKVRDLRDSQAMLQL